MYNLFIMKGPLVLKNRKYYLAIVMVFLVLLSGCAVRTPSQPADTNINLPAATAGGTLKVHFIDVGQGDAILVQTAAGQNMLVDAGENVYGDKVADYLQAQGVVVLDMVVGTHTHSDHIGGLDTVMQRLRVKAVFMPKVTQNTRSFEDVVTAIKQEGLTVNTAKAGVIIPLEGVDCRILAPVADSYEELNDYSAVIRLEYGSHSFLLTGDARSLPENQMLNSGVNLQATVLKVPHHGSYSSSTSRFLAAVIPQYGVISLGAGNDYG